jgi:hypothetical protein
MSNNPKDSLIEIQNRPFLPAHEAITWFRRDYPGAQGRINTRIEQVDGFPNFVLAEIWVNDGNGKMELVATARKTSDGKSTLEKLETGAIRRALANFGYGTVAAMAYDDDPHDTMSAQESAQVAVATKDLTGKQAIKNLNGEQTKTRKFETKDSPTSPPPTFTAPDFDLAYFDGTVADLFSGKKHQDNAVAKMFREGDLTPDMDADSAIEAVMAKYKDRAEAGD